MLHVPWLAVIVFGMLQPRAFRAFPVSTTMILCASSNAGYGESQTKLDGIKLLQVWRWEDLVIYVGLLYTMKTSFKNSRRKDLAMCSTLASEKRRALPQGRLNPIYVLIYMKPPTDTTISLKMPPVETNVTG